LHTFGLRFTHLVHRVYHWVPVRYRAPLRTYAHARPHRTAVAVYYTHHTHTGSAHATWFTHGTLLHTHTTVYATVTVGRKHTFAAVLHTHVTGFWFTVLYTRYTRSAGLHAHGTTRVHTHTTHTWFTARLRFTRLRTRTRTHTLHTHTTLPRLVGLVYTRFTHVYTPTTRWFAHGLVWFTVTHTHTVGFTHTVWFAVGYAHHTGLHFCDGLVCTTRTRYTTGSHTHFGTLARLHARLHTLRAALRTRTRCPAARTPTPAARLYCLFTHHHYLNCLLRYVHTTMVSTLLLLTHFGSHRSWLDSHSLVTHTVGWVFTGFNTTQFLLDPGSVPHLTPHSVPGFCYTPHLHFCCTHHVGLRSHYFRYTLHGSQFSSFTVLARLVLVGLPHVYTHARLVTRTHRFWFWVAPHTLTVAYVWFGSRHYARFTHTLTYAWFTVYTPRDTARFTTTPHSSHGYGLVWFTLRFYHWVLALLWFTHTHHTYYTQVPTHVHTWFTHTGYTLGFTQVHTPLTTHYTHSLPHFCSGSHVWFTVYHTLVPHTLWFTHFTHTLDYCHTHPTVHTAHILHYCTHRLVYTHTPHIWFWFTLRAHTLVCTLYTLPPGSGVAHHTHPFPVIWLHGSRFRTWLWFSRGLPVYTHHTTNATTHTHTHTCTVFTCTTRFTLPHTHHTFGFTLSPHHTGYHYHFRSVTVRLHSRFWFTPTPPTHTQFGLPSRFTFWVPTPGLGSHTGSAHVLHLGSRTHTHGFTGSHTVQVRFTTHSSTHGYSHTLTHALCHCTFPLHTSLPHLVTTRIYYAPLYTALLTHTFTSPHAPPRLPLPPHTVCHTTHCLYTAARVHTPPLTRTTYYTTHCTRSHTPAHTPHAHHTCFTHARCYTARFTRFTHLPLHGSRGFLRFPTTSLPLLHTTFPCRAGRFTACRCWGLAHLLRFTYRFTTISPPLRYLLTALLHRRGRFTRLAFCTCTRTCTFAHAPLLHGFRRAWFTLHTCTLSHHGSPPFRYTGSLPPTPTHTPPLRPTLVPHTWVPLLVLHAHTGSTPSHAPSTRFAAHVYLTAHFWLHILGLHPVGHTLAHTQFLHTTHPTLVPVWFLHTRFLQFSSPFGLVLVTHSYTLHTPHTTLTVTFGSGYVHHRLVRFTRFTLHTV